MSQTRRRFLGAVTASTVVGLTGCLGGGGDGGSPTPTETATATETATESTGTTETSMETTDDGAGATTVQVSTHDEHGDILVDGDGIALYMFDSDEQGSGASTCTGDCLDAWPPLTAEGEPSVGTGVTAEVTTFERDDGSMQVAANGWPLYYFAQDESPGDVAGQGANEVWWLLTPGGEPIRPDEAGASPDSDNSSGGRGSY